MSERSKQIDLLMTRVDELSLEAAIRQKVAKLILCYDDRRRLAFAESFATLPRDTIAVTLWSPNYVPQPHGLFFVRSRMLDETTIRCGNLSVVANSADASLWSFVSIVWKCMTTLTLPAHLSSGQKARRTIRIGLDAADWQAQSATRVLRDVTGNEYTRHKQARKRSNK